MTSIQQRLSTGRGKFTTDYPELGTGAEAVVTRFFHALGYYVPQAIVGTLRRENLVIAKDATVRLPNGGRRPMKMSDVDEQLHRAERNPDGSYRVSGSKITGVVRDP